MPHALSAFQCPGYFVFKELLQASCCSLWWREPVAIAAVSSYSCPLWRKHKHPFSWWSKAWRHWEMKPVWGAEVGVAAVPPWWVLVGAALSEWGLASSSLTHRQENAAVWAGHRGTGKKVADVDRRLKSVQVWSYKDREENLLSLFPTLKTEAALGCGITHRQCWKSGNRTLERHI